MSRARVTRAVPVPEPGPKPGHQCCKPARPGAAAGEDRPHRRPRECGSHKRVAGRAGTRRDSEGSEDAPGRKHSHVARRKHHVREAVLHPHAGNNRKTNSSAALCAKRVQKPVKRAPHTASRVHRAGHRSLPGHRGPRAGLPRWTSRRRFPERATHGLDARPASTSGCLWDREAASKVLRGHGGLCRLTAE